MKSILFTNARDEQNLMEWILHHLSLGFTRIIIFDHKSIQPISVFLQMQIQQQKEQNRQNENEIINKVTIVRIDHNPTKLQLMYNAVNIAKTKQYDWMLYLDCDEFLVLNKDNQISPFLSRFLNYDQVALNWLLFGSNYKEDRLLPGESIIQTYTRSQPSLNQHIKCFLNIKRATNAYIKINTPHCYLLNGLKYSVNVNYRPLNPIIPSVFDTKEDFRTITAFIAHYSNQSYQEYIKRKIRIPRDDIPGVFRQLIQPEIFHKEHNDIENTYVSQKYRSICNTYCKTAIM